jgi:modification methylase
VKNVEYDNSTDKKSEEDYQKEQIEVLNELFRVIKPG